uniref:Uncharacterized protein n=1 Tax=Trichinella nativa TaxID=6335 RepID=A0A0V1KIG8_9BILA
MRKAILQRSPVNVSSLRFCIFLNYGGSKKFIW